MNWIKLVYGPFGQSNMHCTLNLPQTSQERIEFNVPKLKSSEDLTVLIYTVPFSESLLCFEFCAIFFNMVAKLKT